MKWANMSNIPPPQPPPFFTVWSKLSMHPWIQTSVKKVAALKGKKSWKHRGTFVYISVCPFVFMQQPQSGRCPMIPDKVIFSGFYSICHLPSPRACKPAPRPHIKPLRAKIRPPRPLIRLLKTQIRPLRPQIQHSRRYSGVLDYKSGLTDFNSSYTGPY